MHQMGILSLLGKVGAKFIPKLSRVAGGIGNVVSEIPLQSEAGQFAKSNGAYLTGTKNFLKGAAKFVKNELVVNPAERLKGAIPRIGVTLAALTGGTYAATGKFKLPSSRETAFVSAAAVNPLAAGIGFLGSGSGQAFNTAQEKFMSSTDKLKNWAFPKPDMPVIGDINVPDVNFSPTTSTIPDLAPQFALSQPLNIQLPSSNVSVGGGPSMGDALLPLILATAAAGGGVGYLLGRRKKKKRKSKKSKKRKGM